MTICPKTLDFSFYLEISISLVFPTVLNACMDHIWGMIYYFRLLVCTAYMTSEAACNVRDACAKGRCTTLLTMSIILILDSGILEPALANRFPSVDVQVW